MNHAPGRVHWNASSEALRWLATARMPPDRSALRLVPLRQKQLERSVDELVSDLSVPFISVLQARARVSQSGSG